MDSKEKKEFNLEEYDRIRSRFRSHILHLKEKRKVSLGPFTFLFENREVRQYQILELLREGGLCREEDLIQELEELTLPPVADDLHLRATLFIEFKNPIIRTFMLQELRRLNEHIHLDICGYPLQACYDEKVTRKGSLCSVQHLTFPLGHTLARDLLESQEVMLHISHPCCYHTTPLTGELLLALKEDLYRGYFPSGDASSP